MRRSGSGRPVLGVNEQAMVVEFGDTDIPVGSDKTDFARAINGPKIVVILPAGTGASVVQPSRIGIHGVPCREACPKVAAIFGTSITVRGSPYEASDL